METRCVRSCVSISDEPNNMLCAMAFGIREIFNTQWQKQGSNINDNWMKMKERMKVNVSSVFKLIHVFRLDKSFHFASIDSKIIRIECCLLLLWYVCIRWDVRMKNGEKCSKIVLFYGRKVLKYLTRVFFFTFAKKGNLNDERHRVKLSEEIFLNDKRTFALDFY